MGFLGGSDGKSSAHNEGDPGSIPGWEKSLGEGNGNPLQYSCLENSMDGGALWAIVHGVAKSQTRLSDFTFFIVSINESDFCVLILYLATLLNSLISSSNFLIPSLGFSMCSIMSSANNEKVTSFPIWIPFIYVSSLIAVAMTSRTMLNNSSESWHPCIFPDLRGECFQFFYNWE